MNTLLCFGFGYSAGIFAERCIAAGWRVVGTTRNAARAAAINAAGVAPLVFDGRESGAALREAIATATHVLVSIAPDGDGDPVLRCCRADIANSGCRWIGYLSTVGVYGDHAGAWVDETTPLKPTSERSKRRVAAERSWLTFADQHDLGLQIFRLSGIYGPGRSAIDKIRDGTARRLIKPGQVFNRIHVADIAETLWCAVNRPRVTGTFNVTDDLPAPPQDVVTFAAELLGAEAPPEIAFETADLSVMARSFYNENKRVANDKIKGELGVNLHYPTYRQGLAAIVAEA